MSRYRTDGAVRPGPAPSAVLAAHVLPELLVALHVGGVVDPTDFDGRIPVVKVKVPGQSPFLAPAKSKVMCWPSEAYRP